MRLKEVSRCVFALQVGLGASAGLEASEFAGTGLGEFSDQDPVGRIVTFNVAGMTEPLDRVRLSLAVSHSWIGDVRAELVAPDGVARLALFGRVGVASDSVGGSAKSFEGTYTFDDSAQGSLWAAAEAALTSVPEGRYRTSTSGTPLSRHGGCSTSLEGAFSGLTPDQTNGAWTLHVVDVGVAGEGNGNVAAATLTLLDDELFEDDFDPAQLGDCKRALFDFTGTGRTSFAITHVDESPSSGDGSPGLRWRIKANDVVIPVGENLLFGTASDVVLAGDFDGDGMSDPTVWDAVTGHFSVRRSSRPNDVPLTAVLGQPGDNPTHVGDYDGDGIDDFAVHRPNGPGGEAVMLIHPSRGGPDWQVVAGASNYYPSGGVDYSGDGLADFVTRHGMGPALFAVHDGRTGAWLDGLFQIGDMTDWVVVGNHAGSDRYDITVVARLGAEWLWRTRDSESGATSEPLAWGVSVPADSLLSGDYDGDGLDDPAVWRPATSSFHVRRSSNPDVPLVYFFGQQGNPVARTRTYLAQ